MNKLLKRMMGTKMRAVLQKQTGDINTLYLGDTDIPVNLK